MSELVPLFWSNYSYRPMRVKVGTLFILWDRLALECTLCPLPGFLSGHPLEGLNSSRIRLIVHMVPDGVTDGTRPICLGLA